MSLDSRYILKYMTLPYAEPTPMQEDKEYLETKYGGEVINFDIFGSYYYDKPKYELNDEDIKSLKADQVLGCNDNQDIWHILK